LPSWWAPVLPKDTAVASVDRVVVLLYSEALSLLRRARTRTALRRDLHAVTAILVELSDALTQREDRDEVVDLISLYRYMMHRLTAAQGPDVDDALAEVERLFVTLMDGWIQVLPGGSDAGFPDSLESDDARLTPASFPVQVSSADD
jgi:flagellin-specific chaperone FliS